MLSALPPLLNIGPMAQTQVGVVASQVFHPLEVVNPGFLKSGFKNNNLPDFFKI